MVLNGEKMMSMKVISSVFGGDLKKADVLSRGLIADREKEEIRNEEST